jgi:hypothetical protein
MSMFFPLAVQKRSVSSQLIDFLVAGCVAACVAGGLFMSALLLLGLTA